MPCIQKVLQCKHSSRLAPSQPPVSRLHFEVAHRVNVSIVLSSGAITMMVVGLILYCLIKKKIVRCCVKENQAHVVEQGGMAFQHQPPMGPQPGSHPPAPTALQLQAPLTHNLTDIENSLARMQLQYSAMASQLASQKTDQKTSGALGSAPRLNQYPLV